MIKYMDKDRVIVSILATLIIDSPLIYWIFNVLYNLIFKLNLNVLLVDPAISIYFIMTIVYTNFMLHLIMESNATLEFKETSFTYKTLLWFRKKEIAFSEVKKIIVCRERLVLYGDYESIIVMRKGLKRNLFFNEYSMKKDQYKTLKEFFINSDPEKVMTTKKRYIKPLLALLWK